jgi:hypothetical protein
MYVCIQAAGDNASTARNSGHTSDGMDCDPLPGSVATGVSLDVEGKLLVGGELAAGGRVGVRGAGGNEGDVPAGAVEGVTETLPKSCTGIAPCCKG